MKLRILLPATLLLLLSACKHKDDKPQVIYVDPLLKQHFAFKPGSYWIYKDSVSGRVDSCYVIEHDSFFMNYNNLSILGQTIYTKMMQRPIMSPMNDSISITISLGGHGMGIGYMNNYDYGFITDLELNYPFSMGKTSTAPDSAVVTALIPSIEIADQKFLNVWECFYCKYGHPENHAWLYIEDSIGIIKTNLEYNGIHRTWELQRFRILK